MNKIIFKKKYLSVGTAAKFVGVARTTMFRWVEQGITSDGLNLDVVRDKVENRYWISEECLMFLATEGQRKKDLSESQRFVFVNQK